MSNISLCHRDATAAAPTREFWRGVLLDGAFTALPRWTREPVAGVREYHTKISDELVAALCGSRTNWGCGSARCC